MVKSLEGACQMEKVTIQDIAGALGISRNNASKAINNAGGLTVLPVNS